MQTLMLGKTPAAGEIPVTRQIEGGCEEGRDGECRAGKDESGRERQRVKIGSDIGRFRKLKGPICGSDFAD